MIMNKMILFLTLNLIMTGLTGCSEKENDNEISETELTSIDHSRIYTEKFYTKDFEYLYDKFSQDMKNAMSISALGDFHTQVLNQLGVEVSILDEQLDTITTQYDIYNRTASFDKYQGPVLVRWVLDSEMIIQGFLITSIPQEAPNDYLDYETKTNLILPFKNEWFVYWGGRTITENYHAAYPDQRFAYDFLHLNDRLTYTGEKDKNENYYCYGKSVISPGKGKIISLENKIEDNVPGTMNPNNPLGNYVIIDHSNGEYSFIAHFKKNSIILNVGDSVIQGQELGLCGNSGNSSEPHIHYHLQNTSTFGEGDGLPIKFRNFIANGEIIDSGEPVRGQIVKNGE